MSVPAAAEDVLTLERALELAREQAPAWLAASARVDEARARRVGAAVTLRSNPVLDANGGWRFSSRGSAAASVGLSQTVELGGQRGARIAGAEAEVLRSEAARAEVSRGLFRSVSLAFVYGLYAVERIRLSMHTQEVAEEVLRISERRFEAGDIPRLDLNLAKAALARARSDVLAAQALRDTAFGELRRVLGLETEFSVRGDLKDRRRFELQQLLFGAESRADRRVLAAEEAAAKASLELGEALAWPDLGLSLRVELDDGDELAFGGMSLTLPFFDHGQGIQAEAAARTRRLVFERDSSRKTVAIEISTAFDVYRQRVASVEELEQNAIPLLDDNEALAKRSYESGQLGLPDFLVVRRETIGTRLDYLDRLLEAAIAGVELEASAGAFERAGPGEHK